MLLSQADALQYPSGGSPPRTSSMLALAYGALTSSTVLEAPGTESSQPISGCAELRTQWKKEVSPIELSIRKTTVYWYVAKWSVQPITYAEATAQPTPRLRCRIQTYGRSRGSQAAR